MRDKFIKRYKQAVRDYFDTVKKSDPEIRLIKYEIVREYERILQEVFAVSHSEIEKAYEEIYWQTFGDEMNERKKEIANV